MCIRMRNATYTDFSDKERSKLRYSPSSLSTHGAALFISQNYNQRQSSKQKKMTATTAQVCSGFIFPASPNSHPPTPQPPSPLSLLSFLSFLPCCSPPLPSTHVHASSTLLCSIVKANLTPSSSFHLHFHFFFPPFFFLPLTFFLPCFPAIHLLSLTLYIYIYISPYFFPFPFAALPSPFASLLLLLLFYFSLPSLCVLFIFSRHSSVLTPTLLLTFFFSLRFCCRVSHTVSGHHHTSIPHPHRGRASCVADRCRDSPCAPHTRTTRRRRCRVRLPT